MNWDALGRVSDSLLTALARFSSLVDSASLFALACGNDPQWHTNDAQRRDMFRALDLLERLKLVERPDGANLQLTSLGRESLAVGKSTLDFIDRSDSGLQQWAELEDLNDSLGRELATEKNTFAILEVESWRQFGHVAIRFHPRLTILTGANASGKTTLLNILAPHFSWSSQLLSATRKAAGQGTPSWEGVGRLIYTNGARSKISQSPSPGISISYLALAAQQVVPGIFISSHRSISNYQELQNLPARFSASEVLLQQFTSEVQARYTGGATQHPPLYRLKEALVAAAMHGYGNQAVAANTEAREVWEGFQDILIKFLPESLRFNRLIVDDGEIIIETSNGRFPLEAASGGLSAMLELSWQIFLRGRFSETFTVCIDEPENHLHPELQRSIVPALLEAFPKATFVLATHSPFIVTATPECNVYALRPNDSGKVDSRLVEELDGSATPDETLMSVLGLDTALPLWVEQQLGSALSTVPPNPSADDLRVLRNKLVHLGLERSFPAAVEALGDLDR